MEKDLPDIADKRYFTIGEVSDLCSVKPYVLRYWEQEFTQLKPMKRRGNRRYYQRHEVLLIREIRRLLYEQGFTISGARNRLSEFSCETSGDSQALGFECLLPLDCTSAVTEAALAVHGKPASLSMTVPTFSTTFQALTATQVREELSSIRELLTY
jgi:DNA-binding transcriptional MerR regulator